MIEKVEVPCAFVVHKYFLSLADIQFLVIVNGVHITLKQCLEPLGSQIKLRHTVGAEKIYFPVFVSRDAQHRITEQAVRVVLFKFKTFNIITVIAVEPLACAYPYYSPFVDI